MKHPEMPVVAGLAGEFGRGLSPDQIDAMSRYGGWLVDEALPAGGIGPNEGRTIIDRHLLDAVTYLEPLTGHSIASLLDVGSGVGLPGIPLAIALPDTRIVLLDRSGRRCELAGRAVRVLGLTNVEIEQRDVADAPVGWSVVTARASLPAAELLPHLRRLEPEVGIVGGSTQTPPDVDGYRTREITSRYLESPRWLLIMEQS